MIYVIAQITGGNKLVGYVTADGSVSDDDDKARTFANLPAAFKAAEAITFPGDSTPVVYELVRVAAPRRSTNTGVNIS